MGLDYNIGDRIEWGKSAVESPVVDVVIEGTAESIVNPCGPGAEDYYEFIADSVIEGVRVADGTYDFQQ